MSCGKKITREYKAPLPKAEQKRFRSLMWEFRRDPKDLKPEEREALDRLFVALPRLKEVYEVRVAFKEIFDTAPHRATAEQQLAEIRLRTESLGLDFRKFWTTYDNGNVGILNYFDRRYTSAAVEGINNKARVITKRCYGVKSPGTLWHRLILDLNRASEAVGRSIAELREIVSGLKAVFLAFGTENRKSPRIFTPPIPPPYNPQRSTGGLRPRLITPCHKLPMTRCSLLTWTTYGAWLPGDARGSVASVRIHPGPRREHDQPGTPYEPEMPGLHAASERRMKGPPVQLSPEQAQTVFFQFCHTANCRQWDLLGVAIMANHVHIVVALPDDIPMETAVRDFKAYGSRALNARWPRPTSGTWWAAGGGSRRWLPNEAAVARALEYLRNQPHALLIWLSHNRHPEPGA